MLGLLDLCLTVTVKRAVVRDAAPRRGNPVALVREMAMARVRRRVNPRQFQIYDLLVVQGFSMQEVKRFFNVTSMEVYVSRFRVRAEFWRQLAKLVAGR
jgi:hypothetical protein